MADVKWIKIVTDIFEDEKILLIESLPKSDSIIVIWFKLLCLAGKQNNSGVFMLNDIAYTDTMLAKIFRRPISTVRTALNIFEQYHMIEIMENVITIPNWSKHQSLDQIEAKREYMRNYMSEKREKQKLLTVYKANSKVNSKANVSSLEEDKDKDIDKKEIYKEKVTQVLDNLFNQFWAEYPKKVGKGEAKKIFTKLKPDTELTDKMIKAIQKIKCSPQWTKDGGQFIPNPATWLNQGRWEDETPEDKNYDKEFAEWTL